MSQQKIGDITNYKIFEPSKGNFAYFASLKTHNAAELRDLATTGEQYFSSFPRPSIQKIVDLEQIATIFHNLANIERKRELEVLKRIVPEDILMRKYGGLRENMSVDELDALMTAAFTEHLGTKEWLLTHIDYVQNKKENGKYSNLSYDFTKVLDEIWAVDQNFVPMVTSLIDVDELANCLDDPKKLLNYFKHIFLLSFQKLIKDKANLFEGLDLGNIMGYTEKTYKEDFEKFLEGLTPSMRAILDGMATRIGYRRFEEGIKTKTTKMTNKDIVKKILANFSSVSAEIRGQKKSHIGDHMVNQMGFLIEELFAQMGLKDIQKRVLDKNFHFDRVALANNVVTTDLYSIITTNTKFVEGLKEQGKKIFDEISGSNKNQGRKSTLLYFNQLSQEFINSEEEIFVIAESSKYVTLEGSSKIGGGARALSSMRESLKEAYGRGYPLNRIIHYVAHFSPVLLMSKKASINDPIVKDLLTFLVNEIPLLFFDDFSRQADGSLTSQNIPVIHLVDITGFRVPFSLFLRGLGNSLQKISSQHTLFPDSQFTLYQSKDATIFTIKQLGAIDISLKMAKMLPKGDNRFKSAWTETAKVMMALPAIEMNFLGSVRKFLYGMTNYMVRRGLNK